MHHMKRICPQSSSKIRWAPSTPTADIRHYPPSLPSSPFPTPSFPCKITMYSSKRVWIGNWSNTMPNCWGREWLDTLGAALRSPSKIATPLRMEISFVFRLVRLLTQTVMGRWSRSLLATNCWTLGAEGGWLKFSHSMETWRGCSRKSKKSSGDASQKSFYTCLMSYCKSNLKI